MSGEEETKGSETPSSNSMVAFSDELIDLGEALSILYILKNISGRNKFREKWSEVSEYLFGMELIRFDIEGVENREHRAQLEEEADDKRIELKKTITEIVDKSVDAGSLQFDYVGNIIDQYGVDLSTFLYAEDVIERVRPGLLASRKSKSEEGESSSRQTDQTVSSDNMADTATAPEKEKEENEKPPATDEKLSSEEKSLLSNNPDIPKDVKPIETLEEKPPAKVVPDILSTPLPETLTEPIIEEANKIKELTLPQAAKAEKGVYMAMFNALAKAV